MAVPTETVPACEPVLPESTTLTGEWWIVFLTIVGIAAVVTYGFQEKANRWHQKGLVGRKAVMWAETVAVPVCCFLGWFSIYQVQDKIDFMRPWAGLLAGFMGSMASPWFLSLLGRLISMKLGKEEKKEEKGEPPAHPHSTSRPGSSATPEAEEKTDP